MWKPNILLDILFTAGLVFAQGPQKRETENPFDWTSITPTRQLKYHDCYDGYKCARLKVPMDWKNPSNSSQSVAIGIITLPATVPTTDPSFGGTVLINPGGPSGSGTEMVTTLGNYLQGILEGERSYEILGFDPRGIAYSTPHADCYNGDETRRTADGLQVTGIPPPSSGSAALNYLYQSYAANSQLCSQAGNDSIFAHMSTASVARDMLEIVDRVDELQHANSSSSRRTRSEKPKLQYLGVSYGTFLGNTFASMFPNRVGRMVIDGVEDPDDYLKGAWKTNLNDFEVVLENFYKTCFKAGDDCLLRKKSDKNATSIRKRIDSFLDDLEASPIPAVYEGRTHLVTSLLVRTIIHDSLYDPINKYEDLSILLASSLAGNHTLLLGNSVTGLETDCEASDEDNYSWSDNAGAGVLCGDSALDADERNITWAKDIVDTFNRQSPTAGENWTKIPFSCIGWKFTPKFLFRGPFGRSAPRSRGDNHNSSAPLLILSTRYDHATPLANAYKVAKSHQGSTVVVQESFGHTALLTSKSNCTANIVREYFDTGRIPEDGTVCKEDCVPSIPYKECSGLPGYS